VFVTHSIPLTMSRHSDYEAQHVEACRLVAADFPDHAWDLVYCSRSGPEFVPWLEPDVNDHLEALHAEGVPGVVVVPVGFISDHMEVIYDLDVEAKETAERLGLPFARAGTVGVDDRFVDMIRSLVLERLEDGPREALGLRGAQLGRLPRRLLLHPRSGGASHGRERPGPTPSLSPGSVRPMELVLVRHAQPQWNRDRTAQVDPGLTDVGDARPTSSPTGSRPSGSTRCWSPRRPGRSRPRRRCVDRLAADRPGRPALAARDPHARGSWEGTPSEEVGRVLRDARNRPRDEWWDGLPGGESFRDFHARVTSGLVEELGTLGVERDAAGLWHVPDGAPGCCSSPTPGPTAWCSGTCSASTPNRGSGSGSPPTTPR
jgi:hypothetical protein